jgi:uncharacterized delta-60 repeat protein
VVLNDTNTNETFCGDHAMMHALKTTARQSKYTIFRRCHLLLIAGCCAGLAQAQTPGTVDPLWEAPYQAPAPAGQTAWIDMVTQPNGRMVVLGKTAEGYYVRRFADNGWFDQSFGDLGTFTIPAALAGTSSLVVDGAGRIYLNGAAEAQGGTIARLHANGTLDTSFGTGGIATPTTGGGLALQPDGKILLTAIRTDTARPSPATMVVASRLLENGQLDTGFGTNGSMTLASLNGSSSGLQTQVMTDGSFVVSLTEYPAANRTVAHILKRTAAGAADTSFGANGSIVAEDVSISDLALQPDGKLLVSGALGSAPAIARLHANGSLDSNFANAGVASPGTAGIEQIELESGGGIIAATAQPGLIRLTANGAIDSGFVREAIEDDFITAMALGKGAFLLTGSPRPEMQTARNLRKYFVSAEPRTGSLSTDQAPNATGFRIDARNAAGTSVSTAPTTHFLGFNGYIFPQTADLNASAKIFVVVASPTGLFMRNTAGNLVPWNSNIADLVPAFENVTLIAATHVQAYAGTLAVAGAYSMYVGYQRTAGGPLVYIDTPTTVMITP